MNPITKEVEERSAEFGTEVMRYAVAELHVNAFLSTIVIASAHRIKEGTVGIVASVFIFGGMFIIKRRYPHRIFTLVRLDRLYHRITGKVIVIDKKDFKIKACGAIIPMHYDPPANNDSLESSGL